jgi:hypothetical protein
MFASVLDFYDPSRISHVRCAMMEREALRGLNLQAKLRELLLFGRIQEYRQ